MIFEGTVQNNHNRIREISEVHRKEIDKIDQYLRIIDDSKKEKIDALTREHENWIQKREAEIRSIEERIQDERQSFAEKRKNLETSYAERETSFKLRKSAAEAYIEVASKLNTQALGDAVETATAESDLEAISVASELDTMIDSKSDVQELTDLDINIPESEAAKLFAA